MNYKEIMRKLINNNFECYMVGGCVRNKLWNLPVTDVDLVTNATPEQIQEVFKDNSTVTCGNNFLVTLVDGIEVATYRKDRADSAEVARNLYKDVSRRDFTINALAMDEHECVVRTSITETALEDIKFKILRAVGEPMKRFVEDPVRILRGLRFMALYDLEPHIFTRNAMYTCIPLLDKVPRERIRLELKKAMSSRHAWHFLMLLMKFGLFYKFFPSLAELIKDGGKYHAEMIIDHALLTVKNLDELGNENWLLKIAGLYHDIGKKYEQVNNCGNVHFLGHNALGTDELVKDLRSLKFTREEISYINSLKCLHMYCIEDTEKKCLSKKAVRRLVARLNMEDISLKDWFLLRFVDKKSNLKHYDVSWVKYRKIYGEMLMCLKEYKTFSVKDLKVNGRDVMSVLGIEQGREVGDVLNYLLEQVIYGMVDNDKDVLIKLMKESYSEGGTK